MEKNENFDNFLIFFEIFDLFLTIFSQLGIDSVPGRPGTEDFVPGFLLLPLSRDKGHRDKKIPLSRHKGTTGRPVPWKRYSAQHVQFSPGGGFSAAYIE